MHLCEMLRHQGPRVLFASLDFLPPDEPEILSDTLRFLRQVITNTLGLSTLNLVVT
jgi:hypothetical protein